MLIARGYRILVSHSKNSAQPVFALADNEALTDRYKGVAMMWTHYIQQRSTNVIYETSASEDIHSFRLRVHHKKKHLVQQYLQQVRKQAEQIEKQGRELLVRWQSALPLEAAWAHYQHALDICWAQRTCLTDQLGWQLLCLHDTGLVAILVCAHVHWPCSHCCLKT